MSDDRAGVTLPPGQLTPLKLDPDSMTLGNSLTTSIGKKYLMAWAGLLWCGFLLMHMMGNLFIFVGADAFNGYAAKLAKLGPLLWIMEIGLVVLLLLHVILSLLVTLGNWKARPERYKVDRKKGGRGVASSTMIYTGGLILVFVVVHLLDLKFGKHGDHHGKPDYYHAVIDLFGSTVSAVGYLVAVALVGLHASHAFQSSFRTIGLNHDKYSPKIDVFSRLFGVLVFVVYGSIPLWVLLGGAA